MVDKTDLPPFAVSFAFSAISTLNSPLFTATTASDFTFSTFREPPLTVASSSFTLETVLFPPFTDESVSFSLTEPIFMSPVFSEIVTLPATLFMSAVSREDTLISPSKEPTVTEPALAISAAPLPFILASFTTSFADSLLRCVCGKHVSILNYKFYIQKVTQFPLIELHQKQTKITILFL